MPVFKVPELFTYPITPDQFYDSWGVQEIPETGEKRLMRAILNDAIDCVLSSKDIADHVRKTALKWIVSCDKEEWIFSFENICRELGLDASRLRSGILQKNANCAGVIPERTGEVVCIYRRK